VALEHLFGNDQQNAQDHSLVSQFDINILPFDASRLRNVCASLERKIESTNDSAAILEAAQALGSIVDETAVPYLGQSLAKGIYTAPIVIPTLEKIGGQVSARVLIKSLNELPAEYPILAKQPLIRLRAQTKDSSLRIEIDRALQAAS
jgi:hypothetical protein